MTRPVSLAHTDCLLFQFTLYTSVSDIFRYSAHVDLVYFLFSLRYKYFLQDLTENTSPDNPEFLQLSSKCLLHGAASSIIIV